LLGALSARQLLPAIAFVLRNPEAIGWILALSVISAAVQLVISWTIKRYGAVVFATIMTTRQFFSILLSSVLFMTPLSPGQW
jgi:adenosine 3'-phospho 5'-phosphosulfate transporter B2